MIYSELWIDTNRIDVTVDIERTLSGVIEYVTGHLYHIGIITLLAYLFYLLLIVCISYKQ